jgi:hypothetical protein
MTTERKLEPWDELSPEALEKVNKLTDAAHKAVDSMDYNLATDVLKVPGQNWALVSFVSPTSNQKNTNIGMKIRGVFDTRDEAVVHIKKLIKLDPVFDIFICDMYNWCLVPPDPEKIQDQQYQDEELNKIISGYRRNQIYAKEHFEERKRELLEQAAEEAKKKAMDPVSFPFEKENSVGALQSLEQLVHPLDEQTALQSLEQLVHPPDEQTASQCMESMLDSDPIINKKQD